MSPLHRIYTLIAMLCIPILFISQNSSEESNLTKSSTDYSPELNSNELFSIFGDNFFSSYFEYEFLEVAFDLEKASYITEPSDVAVIIYSEGENPESIPIFKGMELVENTERVFIKWNTFNDVNAKEIIVQRSRDGVLWKNIETLQPKGDYDEITNYHFVDYNPIQGTSFYRLKMTDFKGGSVMSSTRGVKVDNKGYVRCFPNPSTGIVSFFINSTEETDGLLEVVNNQGAIVHQESISVPEGSVALKRDFHHLKTGMYIIKLNFNSGLSFTQQEIFQD